MVNVKSTEAVRTSRAWQQLKARITTLRRKIHEIPVSLIGHGCWAAQMRELEECQRKLALLQAPHSLKPPEQSAAPISSRSLTVPSVLPG
jgi:hypothetical protein